MEVRTSRLNKVKALGGSSSEQCPRDGKTERRGCPAREDALEADGGEKD